MQATENTITEQIIGAAFKVGRTLGHGFLEKVYERALVYELQQTGLTANPQHPMVVRYEGIVVGEFTADILVEDSVLVEIKAVRQLNDSHMAQCLNYLRATHCPLCLLINFGKPRVEVKRIAN